MTELRPTELNSAMRKCLSAGGERGGQAVLAAVVREMRHVRGLPDAAGDVGLLINSKAADAVRGLCRDMPGFEDLLRADDCLGQVYQAINEPALAAAYRATARSGGKFDDSEIPAVTQLFTPAWVVRFLLHNTLGRAWLRMHPDSRLELEWLAHRPLQEAATLVVPGATHDAENQGSFSLPRYSGGGQGRGPGRRSGRGATPSLPLPRSTEGGEEANSTWRTPVLARHLTVLDPACGTMNFGTAAFDLLAGMYREEMDRAGRSGWPAEPSVRHEHQVPDAILQHNLFGIDIDPIVLELARVSVAMKLRRNVSSCDVNLYRADALFDAFPGDWPPAFDVIVTNPPYLSARNLPVQRVRRLKADYPAAWRDACACFIDRGLQQLRPGGRAAFLVAQSILFTGSYESWRKQVLARSALEVLAHFGPGLFGVGNAGTLQTAGLVLCREEDASLRQRQSLVAFRVVEPPDAAGKRAALLRAIAEMPGGLGEQPGAGLVSPSPGTPGEGSIEGVFLYEDRRRPSPQPSPGVPGEGQVPSRPHVFHPPYHAPSATADNKAAPRFHLLQKDLATLPRGTWAYWAPPADCNAFATLPRLGTVAAPRQGLATTDNARFVRYWWEVDPMGAGIEMRASPDRWVPYAKGGRFRRWYEAARYRVNWEDDGRDIKASIVARYPYLNGKWQWVAKNAAWYGREGITYSYLTSGRFSARRLEPGCVFDVAGSALFPADERQTLGLLAVLNSSSAARLLNVINPTLNFQVGDLSELPIPPALPDSLAGLVRGAIRLQQRLDCFDETAPDFVAPMPWADAEEIRHTASTGLTRLEREIDEQVADLYGLPICPVEPAAEPSLDRAELARQWISYAIGVELGRWGEPARATSADYPGHTSTGIAGRDRRGVDRVIPLRPADSHWIARLRDRLAGWVGGEGLSQIIAAACSLDEFLARGFFPWHVRRFRRRPVYWVLGDSTTAHLFRHDQVNARAVRYALGRCRAALPAGWDRHIDDGIINLAPLANWVPEPALRRELTQAAADLAAGSYAWSKTAQSMYAGKG